MVVAGSKPNGAGKLGARRKKFEPSSNGNVVAHEIEPRAMARPKSGKRILQPASQNHNERPRTAKRMSDHHSKRSTNVIAPPPVAKQQPSRQHRRATDAARNRMLGSSVLGLEEKRQTPKKVTGLRHIRADRGTNMANALAWGC